MPKKKGDISEKLRYEREYLGRGMKYIVGVDEVGRGPLAGPVVTCAVCLPLSEEWLVAGVDDSKRLSPKKREALAAILRERAYGYSIVRIEADEIDRINILNATKKGMKQAVESLPFVPDVVLTDGNMTLDIAMEQKSIVRGDALSYSIGAASILAKVYRDGLMKEYEKEFPFYGFGRNMGYGTREHIEEIKEHGLCAIHRKTFTKKF